MFFYRYNADPKLLYLFIYLRNVLCSTVLQYIILILCHPALWGGVNTSGALLTFFPAGKEDIMS